MNSFEYLLKIALEDWQKHGENAFNEGVLELFKNILCALDLETSTRVPHSTFLAPPQMQGLLSCTRVTWQSSRYL